MADADKTLEIFIKTFADTTGITLTREQAAALTAALQKQALANHDLAGNTDEAAESAKNHNKHLEGSRFVLREIDKIVPGLGHAIHAAFIGPLGPIILLGVAVHEAFNKLKEYNDELDAVSDAELAQHAETIAGVKSAWDEAQISVGKYYADLATAGQEKDPIKKQLDNIKAVTDAQLDSAKQVIEALGKQEVAWLRANGGSPEQIAAAEERTRHESAAIDARKEFGDGLGGLQAEQQQRSAANLPLVYAANEALAAQATARAAYDSKVGELKDVRGLLDPNSATGKKLAGEMDGAAAGLQAAKTGREHSLSPEMTAGFSPEQMAQTKADQDRLVAEAQARVEEANAERLRLVERERQLQTALHNAEEAKDRAEKAAAAAQERSVTNQGRLRELPGEIDQAGKIQGVKDRGRSELDVLESHAAGTNKTLGQLATATGKTHAQTETIVKGILDHTLNLQVVMAQMQWQLDQQAAQLAAARNRTGG